jgi:hypothetical protein
MSTSIFSVVIDFVLTFTGVIELIPRGDDIDNVVASALKSISVELYESLIWNARGLSVKNRFG